MFNINKNLFKDDEFDEVGAEKHTKELMALFASSKEGQEITEKHGGLLWAPIMLDIGYICIGKNLPDLNSEDFSEILFEELPESDSIPSDAATSIIAELKAFWSFLAREYKLQHAPSIIAELDQDAEEELYDILEGLDEGNSPEDDDNSGPGDLTEAILAMAEAAGFDVKSDGGLQRFKAAFNAAPKF